MTLRDLINKTGVSVNLEKAVMNLTVTNGDDISNEKLFAYFSSNRFNSDISRIISEINNTIKKVPICRYQNFVLYFPTYIDNTVQEPISLKQTILVF